MQNKKSPYPGLRPFTEEESIYFKGRDLHIKQIIEQLEKKKITIITGASGDGKSSLVYAGVIPNARAGFFHAEYNNWLICDFRPERNPLTNLAKTLANNFDYSENEIYNELKLGFSSIIKLFKKSKYFIDKNSENWLNATNDEKRIIKSKGANLFILADQFEEFFTNPENYSNGVPSEEAYVTVNLLLETAGISIVEDLPIFIVFTMRSDFISQSVAFTGLPEYIGYSQFFIPRLQRNEFQQVIEEPAMLAGGKISKRLTETLINESREGFDQLPIIQHTLNQLWIMAESGNDEMDLEHLVKLAGLDTKYLSKTDKQEFEKWIKNQEKFKQKFFKSADLTNVLNTHANILYETAFFYFTEIIEWGEKNITENDAKFIIKTAFQSLTKIDQGRAVRNRATLREITDIINNENISYETVCGVLNIFRLKNNNFLRPFIDASDIETQFLHADTVLDITHEALIRNWELLVYWENEEKENYNNFQDFKIQLQRWIDSGKSKEFVLPLGTLVHFENWYEKFMPNKYWIAKYEKSIDSNENLMDEADILADNIKKYLQISRKTITNIEKAKKRRRAIYLIASIVAMIVLGAFTYWAMLEKANALDQQKIAEEKTRLAEEQTRIVEAQKNEILTANEIAEKERLKAENSAKEALWAKAQSDEAKENAVFLRVLAEEQTIIAKNEKLNALNEKVEADKQRIIAEKAKNTAIVASDSTKVLSYLSLARSLALKAQNPYEDPQINLLLAMQAYYFNIKYGGFERNPDIYNALRYSLTANGKNNILNFVKENIVSFFVDERFLTVHTEKNELVQYDLKLNDILSRERLFKIKIPINSSFFLSDKYLVIGFEDRKQKLYFIEDKTEFNLDGHGGLIRSADKNPTNNEFATAGRDKTIRIWDIKEENQKSKKVYTANSRVNAIKYTADGKNILAACNDGSIILWNVETGEDKLLDKKEGTRAISIGENDKRDVLAVGYDNGNVILVYPNKNYNYKNYLLSNTGINAIDFNSSSSVMSVSKNNRNIDMNNIENMSLNTIKIFDHEVKVRNLMFAKNDRLYGLCEDNTIRFWEKDNKTYADIVKSILKRNFTKEEWEIHVGNNVKYETTLKGWNSK
ncbi:MAG: hypothetical protein JXR51_14870 [Bacteroidales bacterium]|nr:hypothetical protein [Bacteroidales bacterium]MBN2758453.1 hypothetical protein [Bacteroidales bacterium]